MLFHADSARDTAEPRTVPGREGESLSVDILQDSTGGRDDRPTRYFNEALNSPPVQGPAMLRVNLRLSTSASFPGRKNSGRASDVRFPVAANADP
jgi:hypothetical protein